jgi:hypothetical protein
LERVVDENNTDTLLLFGVDESGFSTVQCPVRKENMRSVHCPVE